MPTIPKPSQIGEVSVQNTRRVVDIPVDPTGRAVSQFGQAMGEVADRVQKARTAAELADADLDATRALAEIERSGLQDDDPTTFTTRARQQAEKLFAERGAKLSGVARQAWNLRSKEALGQFELRAADVSRRRSVDLARADLIKMSEKARVDAIDPTLPPDARERAAENYRGTVRMYVGSGVLSDSEGAQEIARWDTLLRGERGRQAAETYAARADEIAGTLATAPQRFDELIGGLLQEVEANPDLDPDVKTRFANAARTGAAVSTVQALIDASPSQTLRLLRDEKAGGPFAALGDKRATLVNAAQAEVQRRQVKFEAEVQRSVASHIEALKMGLPIEKPLPIATVRAALGDATADTYELMVNSSVAQEGLATRPLAEVARVAAQPDPPNATAAQQKAVNAQREAAKRVLAERDSDPAQFAIRRGLADEGGLSQALVEAGTATDGTAFLSSVDKVAALIGQRASQVAAASRSLGMPNRPLTATEAQQLGAMLNGLGATGRSEVLRRLGAKVNDPATFGAIMQQVRPDSPVTAYAGLLTQRTRPVGDVSGQAAAALLLEGEDLLNPRKADTKVDGKSKFSMPADSMMRTQWASYAGKAYRGAPEAEDVAFQAYRSTYAALAAKAGKFDGVIDTKLAKQAAEIATGGVVKWGGSQTLLPWGMDRGTFEDSLREGWPAITAQNPALRGVSYKNVALRPLGGGRYAVENVRREDGSEIVVRVGERAAAPPAPAPRPAAPPSQYTGPDE